MAILDEALLTSSRPTRPTSRTGFSAKMADTMVASTTALARVGTKELDSNFAALALQTGVPEVFMDWLKKNEIFDAESYGYLASSEPEVATNILEAVQPRTDKTGISKFSFSDYLKIIA